MKEKTRERGDLCVRSGLQEVRRDARQEAESTDRCGAG